MIVDDKKGSPIPSQKKQKTKKRGGPKRTFEDDYIIEEYEDIYIVLILILLHFFLFLFLSNEGPLLRSLTAFIFRVYLNTTYFIEIEKLLLKVL